MKHHKKLTLFFIINDILIIVLSAILAIEHKEATVAWCVAGILAINTLISDLVYYIDKN